MRNRGGNEEGVLSSQGLAMCIGYAAAVHFDAVYAELQNAIAINITAKESAFGNFFSVFKVSCLEIPYKKKI